MIRGLALRSVKGWAAPELESTFTRARALCQQLGDPPELFPVLWNLAFFNMIRGDLALVQEQTATLMRAGRAGRAAGVPDGRPPRRRRDVASSSGDFAESSRLLERARELPHARRSTRPTTPCSASIPAWSRARCRRARCGRSAIPTGRWRAARETIALGRSQRQPVTFVFALIVAQGVHLYRGETAEAIMLGDEIVALCREYEFPQEAEWARAFQASAMAVQGRAAEGVAQLRDSLDALHALRSGLTRTMFLSLLADALLRDGRADEGLAVVDEGFAHAERTIERGFLAELHRVRGELLLLDGQEAAAEASLRQALDVARQQQARGRSSCARRPRSRGCCWRPDASPARAPSSNPSTAGSPKAGTPPISSPPGPAVRDWMTTAWTFERKLPTEQQDIAEIVAGILAVQARFARRQKRPLGRGTHTKGVCARATFEIFDVAKTVGDPALAARLARGLFAKPGVYPAIVRFANAASTFQTDSKPDVRALSFSVDVPAGVVGPRRRVSTTR